MTWFKCQFGNGGGGGGDEITITPIIENKLISDSTGYKTVNFSDVSSYTYIYVFVTEGDTTLIANQNKNRAICLKVSDIGNPSNFMLGYYWDSGNITISITKTSITCTNYSNPYRNIYCTIIATNELLQSGGVVANRNAMQLLDRTNLITDHYINNGILTPYNGWSATDFIDIRPYNNTIFFYGYDGLPYTYQYDENKNIVSGLRLNIGKNTYGSNVAYIRTSGGTQYLTSNDYAIFGEYPL